MNDLWQPISREFILDPFPFYAKIREKSPVLKTHYGDWLITRYEDARKILSDKNCNSGNRLRWLTRMVESGMEKGYEWTPITNTMQSFLVLLNPPEHTNLRNFITSIWPESKYLQDIADTTAKQVVSELEIKRFNLVTDFAQKISTGVVSQILGIPREDALNLTGDGLNVLRALDPYLSIREIHSVSTSSLILHNYFSSKFEADLMDEDTMLNKLKSFKTEENIAFSPISLAIFIFIAGIETTASLICNFLNYVINHVEVSEALKEFSSKDVVNEVARMEPSVHLLGRYNKEALFINNTMIPPDSTLTINIGAANRDPDYFEDPNNFNPAREPSGNLTFGAGAHHCLGNQLAIIESEAAYNAILPLIDKLEMKEDIKWSNHLTVRSMKSFILGIK